MKKYLVILAALAVFIGSVAPSVSVAASPSTLNALLRLNVNTYNNQKTTGNASYYGSNLGGSSFGGSQCSTNSLTLCTIIQRVIGYLNQALFLLIAVSVVVFVYNVFRYFIQPNENRKEAGMYVMYSVIGFFIILSVWGLVNILQNTFGLGNVGYAPGSWYEISNIFPR